MAFRNPELLFALFLLLIPLLVHLFRLRKFQREDFTNVKFLKKITRETRKSSRLKKFLVLFTRMLALACLILAFSQPYLPARQAQETSEKIIYLDNSFSMQAPGERGELLKGAIQELLENLPAEESFSLLTNSDEFKDLPGDELREKLQSVEYSPDNLNFESLLLKIHDAGSEKKQLLLISDFQESFAFSESDSITNLELQSIALNPVNTTNFSIDSASSGRNTSGEIELKVWLSTNNEQAVNLPVAVYNANELLARSTARFEAEKNAELLFNLGTSEITEGRIEIEDEHLQYDNSLYFSLNSKNPVKAIAIGENNSFLERIYTAPEFSLETFSPEAIDFNRLSAANLIILNELSSLSSALQNNLRNARENGATIILIPAQNGNVGDYRGILGASENLNFGNWQESELLLTQINFEHSILKDVFETRIENFDYPRVKGSFRLNGGRPILNFQDNSAFLASGNRIFSFSTAINRENSNFKDSPLIVPVFYNMGMSALGQSRLYYEVKAYNEIEIPVELFGDEVLNLENEKSGTFIPLQRKFSDRVLITTDDLPETAGNFKVSRKDESLMYLSFNYHRAESRLSYNSPENSDILKSNEGIKEYFNELKASTQIKSFWLWFVIFALFFVILEMLLLKYLK
ncbi:BatA domain-containing protein [Salegentibacter sp. HM20]